MKRILDIWAGQLNPYDYPFFVSRMMSLSHFPWSVGGQGKHRGVTGATLHGAEWWGDLR